MKNVCFSALMALFLFACTAKKDRPEVAFYSWKSSGSFPQKERAALDYFHCREIFIRFFDADKKNDSIFPLGAVQQLGRLPDSISVVPVIYITNRTFMKLPPGKTQQFAFNVFKKINTIAAKNKITVKKVQFDCDWSDETRENYFCFLDEFRKLSGNKILLSSTIRLHQVKYAGRTGIPPVNEGVLMFYNMGKLQDSLNSIYSKANAQKYMGYLATYPLKLDIALPIFGWQVHYREGKIMELLVKEARLELSDTSKISPTSDPSLFRIKSSFLQRGNYFKKDDVLKLEQVNSDDLLEASAMLAEDLNGKKVKLIFFDLDTYNLNRFSNEELEKISAVYR